MSDHLLHITEIDEGRTYYKLTCEHSSNHERWHVYVSEEGGEPEPQEWCWLQTWWEELGDEMLLIKFDSQPTFPIAVKPSPAFDVEGGSIISEGHTCNEELCCRTCLRHVSPHRGCILR